MKRGARSPAKTVDGLIGIAHGEDVRFGSGQCRQNFDLGEVRILKFVDENEGAARPLRSQQLLVTGEHPVGAGDHVAEGA